MGEHDVRRDKLLSDLPRTEAGLPRAGNVVIRERLGKGGMGAVYLGFDEKLKAEVAVKVLPFEAAEDRSAVERFLREARSTFRVDHQSLVRVLTVDEEAGTHYLVMEFVDGESADSLLKREGALPERDALEIAIEAGEALSAAHAKGILHRDVKPANIMIRFEDGRVKLADLGLAKALGSETGATTGLTATGQMLGTPAYMSPEQATDASRADERSDVYSLGATLYALLSGKAPFESTQLYSLLQKVVNERPEELRSLRPEVSESTAGAVEGLIVKEPDGRPQSMKEAVGLLRGCLDAAPDEGARGLARPRMAGRRKVKAAEELSPTPATAPARTLDDVTPQKIATERQLAPATEAATAGMRAGTKVAIALGALAAVGALIAAGSFLGSRREDEGKAQAEYDAIKALVEEGKQDMALGRAQGAAVTYAETEYGPRFKAQAEMIAAGIERAKREAEERRRAEEREAESEEESALKEARRKLEAELAAARAAADAAEKGGDIGEAMRQLELALDLREDAAVRQRLGLLQRLRRAETLLEQAASLEKAGQWAEARGKYEEALRDAKGEAGEKARARLDALKKRLAREEAVAQVQREVEAGKWREAWKRIVDARKAGIDDPRLREAMKRAAAKLGPPDSFAGPLGMELVLVRGGTFRMGSASGELDERPVHAVTVSTFYVGRFEVTGAQFEAFRKGRREAPSVVAREGREPAVSVSWREAVEFCKYLSSIDPTRTAYRLPTEAEWEFASRGEEGRVYPWGKELPTYKKANLNLGSGSRKKLAAVGSYPDGATPGGVHDLVGNAAEWCADWFGPYRSVPQKDPAGPAKGTEKVVRGGAYELDASWAKATVRGTRAPDRPSELVGFRVVRELTPEEREFERIARNE